MTAQDINKPGVGFVVSWVIAFAVSNIVRVLLTSGLEFVFSKSALGATTANVIAGIIGALIAGVCLGAAQGWAMLNYMKRTEAWMLWSGLGYVLGTVIGVIAVGLLQVHLLLAEALAGLIVGVCQWLILRTQVEQSGWWIVTNVIAWSALSLVLGEFGNVLFSPVTGLVMLWLLNHPKQPTRSATSTVQVN